MSKAYWVTCYRQITDPEKLAAYAKLAAPAIEAAGGKYLVRGLPVQAHEAGQMQRTVVIEFETLQQAIATHDSPSYQMALAALNGGVVRDLRIIGGV